MDHKPAPVGASLLAIATIQSTLPSLTHRYREQARSHRGSRASRPARIVTTHPQPTRYSWQARPGHG
nr:hypothetical protein C1892_13845 [Pseudomonas sp. MPBD7-1]